MTPATTASHQPLRASPVTVTAIANVVRKTPHANHSIASACTIGPRLGTSRPARPLAVRRSENSHDRPRQAAHREPGAIGDQPRMKP